MSGHVGDLSPKQEEALKTLKVNCKDVCKPEWDDYYWLRWLRARQFDLKKTEKMLRNDVQWREANKIDELVDWEIPEVLRKYFPGGYFGEDKEGCPIWIGRPGLVDMKGMYYSATKKDILKWMTYNAECLQQKILPEQRKKHGKRIERSNLIVDLAGIGLKNLWKPAVDVQQENLATLEAHYPESLQTCYVVNAPKILPILWKIIKPLLHEETRARLKLLGKNWKTQLLEYIDADQLPVHWGGTARDPDDECSNKVCPGGKIPEKFNMKNIRENIDLSNFENCTVQRGSTVQLDYDVTEPGSTLRWQFLSKGNDLGFGVFRRTEDSRQKKADMDEVVKSERVNSHMVPEEGSVLIEDTGTYVVRFDNTYSWVNAKKVAYLIDVLPPDTEDDLETTDL